MASPDSGVDEFVPPQHIIQHESTIALAPTPTPTRPSPLAAHIADVSPVIPVTPVVSTQSNDPPQPVTNNTPPVKQDSKTRYVVNDI